MVALIKIVNLNKVRGVLIFRAIWRFTNSNFAAQNRIYV